MRCGPRGQICVLRANFTAIDRAITVARAGVAATEPYSVFLAQHFAVGLVAYHFSNSVAGVGTGTRACTHPRCNLRARGRLLDGGMICYGGEVRIKATLIIVDIIPLFQRLARGCWETPETRNQFTRLLSLGRQHSSTYFPIGTPKMLTAISIRCV